QRIPKDGASVRAVAKRESSVAAFDAHACTEQACARLRLVDAFEVYERSLDLDLRGRHADILLVEVFLKELVGRELRGVSGVGSAAMLEVDVRQRIAEGI